MLSGCVIAWFNVIDPGDDCKKAGIPVICVTYEESKGLAGDIIHHFPNDANRLAAYLRLGDRVPVMLTTPARRFLSRGGISMHRTQPGSAMILRTMERFRSPCAWLASAPAVFPNPVRAGLARMSRPEEAFL